MRRFKAIGHGWYPGSTTVEFNDSVDDLPSHVLLTAGELDHVPYGQEWQAFFGDLDIIRLFKLSVRSADMLNRVLHFVAEQPVQMLFFATPGIPLSQIGLTSPCEIAERLHADNDTVFVNHKKPLTQGAENWKDLPAEIEAAERNKSRGHSAPVFPVEIFLVIMEHSKVSGLVLLAQVSQLFRSMYARMAQRLVDNMLLDYGLCPSAIRFMQAATLTIIAGTAMTSLMHGVGIAERETLELICPHDALPWVTRFIPLATEFKFRGHYTAGFRRRGTVASFIFAAKKKVNEDAEKTIRLFSSPRPSALHNLSHAPFTHQFGAITHAGLLHMYPLTTFAGMSLPNRPMLPLRTVYESKHLRIQVAEVGRRGYDLSVEWAHSHICGAATSCPSSPRTTLDHGSFILTFANMYRVPTAVDVYPVRFATGWNLGGTLCDAGNQMQRSDLLVEKCGEARCDACSTSGGCCTPTGVRLQDSSWKAELKSLLE
ncbi:hypothetical protein C8R43DRAFT_1139003 [Mycena crocata]|nr:hypothetical protein C8R43DRAFT_1139003 [Mycena crocata]